MRNIEKNYTFYMYIFSIEWFFCKVKGVRYFHSFRHELQVYNMYKDIEKQLRVHHL